MGMNGRRQENRQGCKRPYSSDPFYLEDLLDRLLARRAFVERGGHVMFKDSYKEAKARRENGPLKLQAHDAYLAYLWGDGAAVDAFLHRLFWSWPHFDVERRSALREALFGVLRQQYCRPAADSLRSPPPWSAPGSSNPKAWLATRVWGQSTTIIEERHKRDGFAQRTEEQPLDAVRLNDLSGWGGGISEGQYLHTRPEDGRRAVRWSNDIGDGREHDPGGAGAAEYIEWIQAIERVATHGRPESRLRAQTVLRALREHWDRHETIEAVGSANAWKAFKTAVRDELKKTS